MEIEKMENEKKLFFECNIGKNLCTGGDQNQTEKKTFFNVIDF
jgi:hypothetical protein